MQEFGQAGMMLDFGQATAALGGEIAFTKAATSKMAPPGVSGPMAPGGMGLAIGPGFGPGMGVMEMGMPCMAKLGGGAPIGKDFGALMTGGASMGKGGCFPPKPGGMPPFIPPGLQQAPSKGPTMPGFQGMPPPNPAMFGIQMGMMQGMMEPGAMPKSGG